MATPLYADFVEETSTTTGTGNLTLNGVETGKKSFFAAFSTTQQFEYSIFDGSNYETGLGQMADASTLQRLTIRSSSNGDNAVDWDASTKLIRGKISGSKLSEVVKQIVRLAVRNETGATLSKGVAVARSGYNTTELLPLVAAADKDTARPAFGLVESDISQNTNGYVIGFGYLENFNTSSWADGDPLFLGDAGALVNAIPSAGKIQYIGSVVRSHASAGVLLINALQAGAEGLAYLTGAIFTGATQFVQTYYSSTLFDAGNKTGASQNINWTNGNLQRCTLTGNVTSSTFTAPSGVTNGLWLRISQDGTGSRTFAWPANVIWDRVTTPTLSTGASVVDSAFFAWDGTNYRGSFWKGSA